MRRSIAIAYLLCLKFLVEGCSLDEYRLKYQLSETGVKRENKDELYGHSYPDLPPAR